MLRNLKLRMCQRISWKNTLPYILHEMSVENFCQYGLMLILTLKTPNKCKFFLLLKLSEEEVKIQRVKVGEYEGSLRIMFFEIY
jgi:hypothetical protein